MPKIAFGGAAKAVKLPLKIVKALQLVEGDELEVHFQAGAVLMMPRKAIPKGQEWFWTPEHQAREREADEDIRLGRGQGPFTAEESSAFLKSLQKRGRAKRKTRKSRRAA